MQFIDEISKVYNSRINSNIPSMQARNFDSVDFSKNFNGLKIENCLSQLQSLNEQGIIKLYIDGSFVLTDYGIEYFSI